jgi:hypothetical protein
VSYSCTARASDTEQAWAQACYKQTGQSNAYEVAGQRYFYDTGREQRDGAITGTVYRVFVNGTCAKSGSFRIESDGTVSRYPTGLRKIIG